MTGNLNSGGARRCEKMSVWSESVLFGSCSFSSLPYQFFTELLCKSGISPEVAEKEACEIEHVISEESFQKIKKSHQEWE